MIFRQAEAKDKQAVMELWKKDFESYEPYYSWYFNTIYDDSRTYLLEDEGNLVACAQLAPYMMRLRGQQIPFNYIVGVITQPEYRGLGLGAKLMRELAVLQKKQEVAFAVLLPVCPEFYFKLGFSYCYEDTVWDVPLASLRSKGEFNGSWQEYEIAQAIPHLMRIYNAMTNNLNGIVLRTVSNWHNFLEELQGDGGKISIYKENELAKAYILHLPKEAKLYAREIGYIEPYYQNACFSYLKKQFLPEQKLYWQAPQADNSYLQLPLQDGLFRRPSVMVHLNNISALLRQLDFDLDAQFSWQIIDKFEEGNALQAMCRIIDGKIKSEPLVGEPSIKIEINALTQLIFGFLSAAELQALGSLSCGEEALQMLTKLFPKQKNWLSEQS